MKAKEISGQAPGGKRTLLKNVLPLDTPYVVQIFPIYACNFKCGYCIYSVDRKDRYFISDKSMMKLELYKKCVDEMAYFPNKIKVLRFVGIGEPLLHKNIAEMIKYTKEKEIANTVEMLTNASRLTHDMTHSIVEAGLDRLVVSLQGVNKEKYKDVAEFDVDMDEFISNLKYFYENKKNTHVYIKIVDVALDNKEEEKLFYEMFGDICDTMAIENTVPIHTGVNFEDVIAEKETELTQFGLPIEDVKVCPQPFFHMQINPDGKVVPCYSFEYPEILGDCNEQSVTEIWNSKAFNNFRLRMLDGVKKASKVCEECSIIKYRWFPEDDLSKDTVRIKKYYE